MIDIDEKLEQTEFSLEEQTELIKELYSRVIEIQQTIYMLSELMNNQAMITGDIVGRLLFLEEKHV